MITDNHMNYTFSYDVTIVLAQLDAHHKSIKPHCSCQNGNVERFNRTLASEWAYRQGVHQHRRTRSGLLNFLDYVNHRRRHRALGGPPTSVSPG